MERTLPRAFAGKLARSVVRPARRDVPVQPLRAFVGLPVVFDLVSLGMQVIDLQRSRRIKSAYAVENAHHRAAHDYNAGVTLGKGFTSTRRMEVYYKLMALPPRDLRQERLLIVGPRDRHELLAAWVHGFAWKNIDAIDLYSTHPKIRVMNMEAMDWLDAQFDAVAMANTLSYSEDTTKTIAEVARVLGPGGRFAFSATYDPEGSPWKGDSVNGSTIAELLRSHGLEIQMHLANDKINSRGRRQTSHAFLARKLVSGESRLDPFSL
jgi:SAM-dependent methyltransferase